MKNHLWHTCYDYFDDFQKRVHVFCLRRPKHREFQHIAPHVFGPLGLIILKFDGHVLGAHLLHMYPKMYNTSNFDMYIYYSTRKT